MKKLSFLIVVFWFLVFWWPFDWKAHADIYSCRQDFWIHAIEASVPWKCTCEKGYIWNYWGTECIVASFQNLKNLCQSKNGSLATYSDKTDECICSPGSTWNNEGSKCIELTSELALKNCKKLYWAYATTGDSLETCNCISGAVFSSDWTQCVLNTKDEAQSRCEAIYWIWSEPWSDLTTCQCKAWFIRNKYKTECFNEFLLQKDVPLLDELKQAIQWMYDNKLTIFNSLDTFMADSSLTREQAAKFFVQAVKKVWKFESDDEIQHSLSDINKADPSLQDYIIESVKMWLFQWTRGRFNPFNKLTKAQALAVLMRTLDGSKPEDISPWYLNYYLLAEKRGYLRWMWFSTAGLDAQNITRGEAALLLYRAEKKEWDNICRRDMWENFLWEGRRDLDGTYICWCKYGYQMSKDGKQCISEEVVQAATLDCRKNFWEHSYGDGSQDISKLYNCRCEYWYNRDNEKNPTRCI